MIPIDALRQVKTIVVHGNCPDGLASAIILDDVLPGREIIHATHNVTQLEAKPNTLFCDFSPPRDRIEEFRAVDTIVLDHHIRAKDVVQSFALHAFGDEVEHPGVSGAMLAFQEVWLPLWLSGDQEAVAVGTRRIRVERCAKLAGIRDTWQQADPLWSEACAQAEALMFYPLSYWLDKDIPREALRYRNINAMSERMAIGAVSLERKLAGAKKTAEKAFYFQTKKRSTKVAIIPTMTVSDAADFVATDTQLIIGFGYTVEQGQQKLLLSTRARNGFDCSEFCVFYGGGGHTGAAGCQIDLPTRALNPYDMIQGMIERFETSSDSSRQ